MPAQDTAASAVAVGDARDDGVAVAVREDVSDVSGELTKPRPAKGKTAAVLAALWESRRQLGVAADNDAIPADEYFFVRLRHVAVCVERVRCDLYTAEASDRAAMHTEYKERTFDLLWEHRQRQKQLRQQFEDDVVRSRHDDVGVTEAQERQALFDAAVTHFDEQLTLEEHRRKDRIRRQGADLREAVLTQAEQDEQYMRALDHCDAREVALREEARGRDAIVSEEDEAARDAWASGVLGLKRLRVAKWEESGRARIAETEDWARENALRFLQATAVVVNAEAYYRGTLAEYEEPRRRDTLEQKWLRERDFMLWQIKARTSKSRWTSEGLGDPLHDTVPAISPFRVRLPTKRRDEIRKAAAEHDAS